MKLSIKSLLLLLAVSMASIDANAYDFMVGGLCYKINENGNSVTLTYERYDSPRYASLRGAVTIPSSVTYNGKTYTVTNISDFAFYECSGITSVTIPNSVNIIGTNAFTRCYGLTSVTISNSVTRLPDDGFYECTSLTSVTIPNSVKIIGQGAFHGCSSLTSATIGNSVTNIKQAAFYDCSRLTSIHCKAKHPPICQEYTFRNVPKETCTLTVPKGCGDDYRYTAYWHEFPNVVEFSVEGDVDGDDKVDVNDINVIVNIILGEVNPEVYHGSANVDGQGSIDVNDINVLLNIILGK